MRSEIDAVQQNTRFLWWASAVFALFAGVLFPFDLFVAREARLGNAPGDLRTIVRLAEVFSHGYGALLIILTVGVVHRLNPKQYLPLIGLTFIPGAIVMLMKLSIARRRPNGFADELPQSVTSTFEGVLPWLNHELGVDRAIQSFPSGHSATGFGLAIALSCLYPHAKWWFGFLACLAAFQRIDSGAHFPSDTAFGGALACAVGAVMISTNSGCRELGKIRSIPPIDSQSSVGDAQQGHPDQPSSESSKKVG